MAISATVTGRWAAPAVSTIRFGPMGRPAGCRVCGQPLSFHQQVAGQICGDWRCRTGVLERDMAAHRERAGLALDVDDFSTYAMVVVPDEPRDVHPVPDFRHRTHVNRLFDLCVKTLGSADTAEDPDDKHLAGDVASPAALASGICAICRGTCCHMGGEHAFLDPPAIHCFTRRCGINDPLEVVYAYAARLPRIAAVDGCVYQAETGCSLPRWMRAAICNAYRCKGLRNAETLIDEKQASRFYVVVRKDNQIQRSAFIDRTRIRHFPADAV